MRKIAKIAAGVAVTYFVLLVLGGMFGGGCVKTRIEERLAKTLDADVEIGDISLSLVRGKVELRDLVIERKAGAHMRIEIDTIVADLAPLGWMIFDRDADEVLVRDADISLSAAGAIALRNVKAPVMKIHELRLDDVRLHVAPTALLPVLGAIDVTIDQATTAPVEVRSALSWIFAIQSLQAKVDAPAGVSVGVGYGKKTLNVSGSMFGSAPMAIPFELPVPDPSALELAQLREVATKLAKALGKETVERWLKDKIDAVKDLVP